MWNGAGDIAFWFLIPGALFTNGIIVFFYYFTGSTLNRSSNQAAPFVSLFACKPYAHYWHSKLQILKGDGGGVKKNNNKKRTDKERRCISLSVVCSTTFWVHSHKYKSVNGYPLAILVEIKETAGLGHPDLDARWMTGIFGCNAIRVSYLDCASMGVPVNTQEMLGNEE